MLRPIEFSLNSPDNVLVGVNAKYSFNSSYTYGQLVLDEFSLTDLRSNKGFWANKIGYQLGYKVFDPFNMNSLLYKLNLIMLDHILMLIITHSKTMPIIISH